MPYEGLAKALVFLSSTIIVAYAINRFAKKSLKDYILGIWDATIDAEEYVWENVSYADNGISILPIKEKLSFIKYFVFFIDLVKHMVLLGFALYFFSCAYIELEADNYMYAIENIILFDVILLLISILLNAEEIIAKCKYCGIFDLYSTLFLGGDNDNC